jgi:hypothetical protein
VNQVSRAGLDTGRGLGGIAFLMKCHITR